MYSLNGIPLDNPEYGWTLLEASSPLLAHSANRSRLQIPGRDGSVRLPATTDTPIMRLTVETPRANAEALLALAASDPVITRTAPPGPDESAKSAQTEFLASSPIGVEPDDAMIEVDLMLQIPGAFWRDVAEVTQGPFTLVSASQEIAVLTGISAPVQDAIVRVKGAATGVRVTDDAGGSWFAYSGELAGTDYLRFEAATGRAYVTTSNVWTGGTEVSGAIDYDGPRQVFELTPRIDVVDPTSRGARLVVTSLTRSAAEVSVRARGAYRAV